MVQTVQERVIAYIDGFNLYFGLRDSRMRRFYWLNMHALASNLLKTNQTLQRTKYFTARISGPSPGNRSRRARRQEAKRKRQNSFLEALSTVPDLDIFFGHYLAKPIQCHTCQASWESHEEKMTDVNIATEMLTDAFEDRFDVALLVSADSDLVSPVKAVHRLFPTKRVIIALPPARHSKNLVSAARGHVFIGAHTLASACPEMALSGDLAGRRRRM